MRRAEIGGRREIVDDLRHDPRPIDRVDARQRRPVPKRPVVEHRFDQRLAVVEIPLDRNWIDIGLFGRRHLPLLYRRNLSLGKENEDIGAIATTKCLDRRAAGVAGSGADNGRALAAFFEHMIHQPGEQLHRDVLESQSRSVKQFQDPFAGAGLDQRGDGLVAKSCIGFADHGGEGVPIDFPADKRLQHDLRRFVERPTRESRNGFVGNVRPVFGKIKPSIGRKAGQQDITETQHRCRAAGTKIAHGEPFHRPNAAF